MLDKLLHVLYKWLFPPGVNATPEEHHNWRIGIAGAVLILTVIVAVQLMWALGIKPFDGDGGVMMLADGKAAIQHSQDVTTKKLDDLTAEVRQTRVQELVGKILQAKSARCEIDADPSQARLAALLDQQLVELQDEYLRKHGQPFPLPECSKTPGSK